MSDMRHQFQTLQYMQVFDYYIDENNVKTLCYLELCLKYMTCGGIKSRDFPKEFVKDFSDIIQNQKFFFEKYDYKIPIREKYSPEELEVGLLNLKKERDYLISETQKYLPSCEFVFGESDFVLSIATEYDILIYKVKEYMRIMKLEDPCVVFSEDQDLNPPQLITNYYHTLNVGDFRIEQLPRPEIKENGKKFDRFTGDLDLTWDLINFYNLKNKYAVATDEVVLSQLKKLKPSEELNVYMQKICDLNLLLDQNNFRDLYILTVGKKEDEFTMDIFWNNYNSIKDKVFSKEISKYSPRLIKLLVTLEAKV